jgi:hypothetical protein
MERGTNKNGDVFLHLVIMQDGRRLSYYRGASGATYVYDKGIRVHGHVDTSFDGLLFVPDTPTHKKD